MISRRGGQILPDLEVVWVGHPDVPRLHVIKKNLITTPQAVATRVDCLAHGDRVGEQEVRRGHRIEPLAPPERGAAALLARQRRRVVEHVLGVAREREVPLFHQIPGRRLGPDRVDESLVILVRRDRIRAGQTHTAVQGVQLQPPQVRRQAHRPLRQLLRVREPCELSVHDGCSHAEWVDRIGNPFAQTLEVLVKLRAHWPFSHNRLVLCPVPVLSAVSHHHSPAFKVFRSPAQAQAQSAASNPAVDGWHRPAPEHPGAHRGRQRYAWGLV